VDVTGLLNKNGCSMGEVTAISRAEQGQPGTYEVSSSSTGMSNLYKFLKQG